ncbi:hypothetical protein GCM10010440_70580 [Kitasatospora cinereorecta]
MPKPRSADRRSTSHDPAATGSTVLDPGVADSRREQRVIERVRASLSLLARRQAEDPVRRARPVLAERAPSVLKAQCRRRPTAVVVGAFGLLRGQSSLRAGSVVAARTKASTASSWGVDE